MIWATAWQNQSICPVWSESSLCTQLEAKDIRFLHAQVVLFVLSCCGSIPVMHLKMWMEWKTVKSGYTLSDTSIHCLLRLSICWSSLIWVYTVCSDCLSDGAVWYGYTLFAQTVYLMGQSDLGIHCLLRLSIWWGSLIWIYTVCSDCLSDGTVWSRYTLFAQTVYLMGKSDLIWVYTVCSDCLSDGAVGSDLGTHCLLRLSIWWGSLIWSDLHCLLRLSVWWGRLIWVYTVCSDCLSDGDVRSGHTLFAQTVYFWWGSLIWSDLHCLLRLSISDGAVWSDLINTVCSGSLSDWAVWSDLIYTVCSDCLSDWAVWSDLIYTVCSDCLSDWAVWSDLIYTVCSDCLSDWAVWSDLTCTVCSDCLSDWAIWSDLIWSTLFAQTVNLNH